MISRMQMEKTGLIFSLGLVAIAGFFLGRLLHSSSSGEVYEFDLSAPAYEAALAGLRTSQAGFTGFAEGDPVEGATFFSGRVTAISDEKITIAGSLGSEQSFSIESEALMGRFRLARLADLAEDQHVFILTGTEGTRVASILILAFP